MAIPRVNLFCLPYAGASAAIYRGWKDRLPQWIDLIPIHLPGRGLRYGEPPIHEWPRLIDLLLSDMQASLSRPFAIFGHSMGALIGIELAYAIRDRYRKEPIWFGASGSAAPNRRQQELDWLDCPEELLLKDLRSRNGTPPELLENRELLDLALPAIRADFHLCGAYQAIRRRPLDCPILVLGGTQDDICRSCENLADWAQQTSRSCRIEIICGDHFFINTKHELVVAHVIDGLRAAVRDVACADA